MIRVAFFLLALLAGIVPSLSARASEFEKPSHESMIKTLIRYGALNINDDALIDEFALLTECKIYAHFYDNDFRWQDVRAAFRKKIRKEVGVYPTAYYHDAELQLDRYDFNEKIYLFKEAATIRNVNAFVVFDTRGYECGGKKIKNLPLTFRIALRKSLYIPGLPLSRDDANALLKRMNETGNNSHIIPVRFNMRVLYVAPFSYSSDRATYVQDGIRGNRLATLDGRINSIDFYEDAEKTKLIYSYQGTE